MAKRTEQPKPGVPETPAALKAPEPNGSAAIEAGKEPVEGFENAQGASMYSMLRLAQPSTQEVAAGNLPVGCIYDSLTLEQIVPKDRAADVVVAYHYMSWIEWHAEMGKGIIAASADPKSELALMARKGVTRENSRKPRVTEYHNFVLLLPDVKDEHGNPRVFLLACSKTSYKAGKKLLLLARMKGKSIYCGMYEMRAVVKKKDTYTWFELEFANSKTNGGLAPDDILALAKDGYNKFKTEAEELQKQAEAALEKEAASGGGSSTDDADDGDRSRY